MKMSLIDMFGMWNIWKIELTDFNFTAHILDNFIKLIFLNPIIKIFNLNLKKNNDNCKSDIIFGIFICVSQVCWLCD
jgi:hypothetical protein